MAKGKFYAVKKGRVPGIYRTWNEAEEQVEGFSGAQYKSFSTQEEAEGFILGKKVILLPIEKTPSGLLFYTDGSYRNNKGGWGYILVSPQGDILEEKSGSLAGQPTNNRGELTAILSVLQDYPKEDLTIHTDSTLCRDTLSKWAYGWERRGWKKSNGEEPANLDLIKDILRRQEGRRVVYKHVYGHSGNYFNEYVDGLAKLHTTI